MYVFFPCFYPILDSFYTNSNNNNNNNNNGDDVDNDDDFRIPSRLWLSGKITKLNLFKRCRCKCQY